MFEIREVRRVSGYRHGRAAGLLAVLPRELFSTVEQALSREELDNHIVVEITGTFRFGADYYHTIYVQLSDNSAYVGKEWKEGNW